MERIYADRSGQAPVQLPGLPRTVLANLREAGWVSPYVVQEIVEPTRDDTPMPWA